MTDTTTTETDDRPPLLERARAVMPGLAELDTALTNVQSRMAAAGARATSESDLVNAAAADAVRSYTVPDDLGERLVKQRRLNEEAHAEAEALRRVQERLEAAERDRHRDRADDGLAVLGEELDVLLSQAAPVLSTLGNIDSADAAIERGRADEWRQARALAERHAELRLAQQIVVSAVVSPPRQGRVDDSVSPEARTLTNMFGVIQQGGQHADVAAHVKVAAMGPNVQRWTPGLVSGRPEPRNQPPVPPWLVADQVGVLRFLIRPDVEPWVPKIAELRAAQNEVMARHKSGNNEENPVTGSAEIEAAWRERGERSPRERGLIGGRYVF